MLANCNFSYKHYTDILKELKKSYTFTTYRSASNNDIILRHDIDATLHAAYTAVYAADGKDKCIQIMYWLFLL